MPRIGRLKDLVENRSDTCRHESCMKNDRCDLSALRVDRDYDRDAILQMGCSKHAALFDVLRTLVVAHRQPPEL
jgi:hypothetical protein